MRSFEEILPEVVEQTHRVESARKKCLASRSSGQRRIGGILLVTIALAVLALSKSPIAAGVIGVVGLVIMAIVHHTMIGAPFQQFRADFKANFIGPSLSSVATNVHYEPQGHDQIFEEYRLSELFPHRVDRRKIEDTVFGVVGETDVKFSELHTEYKTTTTDNKGRKTTHWHTIFRGLFISADFHKEFHGTTFVRSDVAEKAFGMFGRMFQKPIFSSLELVQLEDLDFEKQFVVHSSDQVEARYILTPSLMQRMLALKDRFSSQVEFSFVHSRVFIAISTAEDFFEPNVHQSLYDNQYLRNYIEQIHLCLGAVEELGLNVRIWSKQ